MKKLFIGKNEGVAEVVEKIISDVESEIVLVIPKGADLGESVSNFHLIKREADAASKNLLVESVDEEILALAKSSHIEAAHPLFEAGEKSNSAFSDIVLRRGLRERVGLAGKKKKSRDKHEENKRPHITFNVAEREENDSGITVGHDDEQKRARRFSGWTRKHVLVASVPVLVVGVAIWLISVPFSRATVTIDFNKTPWTYEGSILADTSISKINFEGKVLPAELFTSQKNSTQLFPASGSDIVSEKATGRIVIYNAYSSKSQILVATTRFETPEGRVFRIIDQVLVPGAEIKNGDVIPASIEVDVVADKPGDEYNVGPISKLSVPGFKGTPRFDGFYGEIKEPTKGGFIGKKPVPTSDDIKNAKDKTEEILKSSLKSNFVSSYPKEFKILDEASEVEITKLKVGESTDSGGNFSVFGEAIMKTMGFREEDLRSFLQTLANKDHQNTAFRELNLDYSKVEVNFDKGRETFFLSVDGVLQTAFSTEEFRDRVLGMNVDEVRALVSGLEELSGAKVSLWPIWLNSLPSDPNKVKVVIQ